MPPGQLAPMPSWVAAAQLGTALQASKVVPVMHAAADRERRLAAAAALARQQLDMGASPEASAALLSELSGEQQLQPGAQEQLQQMVKLTQEVVQQNQLLQQEMQKQQAQLTQQQVRLWGVTAVQVGPACDTQQLLLWRCTYTLNRKMLIGRDNTAWKIALAFLRLCSLCLCCLRTILLVLLQGLLATVMHTGGNAADPAAAQPAAVPQPAACSGGSPTTGQQQDQLRQQIKESWLVKGVLQHAQDGGSSQSRQGMSLCVPASCVCVCTCVRARQPNCT